MSNTNYRGRRKPQNSNGKTNYNPKNKGGRKPKFNDKNKEYDTPKSEKISSDAGDVNNPAFYYENSTVLDQVMNFSFNQFGGVPFRIERAGSDAGYFNCYNPMVSTYKLNPSIPIPEKGTENVSGVTIASLRNYLMLSGSNAKTTNYAPQDVAILQLALAEIIKMSTFCARALGVAYLFNYRNRSYPEALLASMDIDPDDFKEHLAQYRVEFNKLMAVASKIPFPATIPLFAKAATLYGSFYLDDNDSALAQTYSFAPYSVWKFKEDYNEQGAGLVTTPFCATELGNTTFQDKLDVLSDCINSLLNSTSLNYIYSDIMRLVQNNKITQLITFGTVDESFMVVPVYNEEVETWLHNAIIIGRPLTAEEQKPATGYTYTPDNDISCLADTNQLFYRPQFKFARNFGDEAMLDFSHDNVTVEEKVRATRFSQRYKHYRDNDDKWRYTTDLAFSDEYIVRMSVWNGYQDGSEFTVNESCFTLDPESSHPITTADACHLMHNMTKFDWAPLIYIMEDDDNMVILGDLDYYTTLRFSEIYRIYDYEILHFLQIQ